MKFNGSSVNTTMNYKRIYTELVEKRQNNPITAGYKENHHIKMKSLGGDNSKENMVYLTAREHYVAHLLLHKFMKCSKTAYALWMMQLRTDDQERIPYIKGSRMYEWARKEVIKYISKNNSKSQIGKGNSQYGKMWICNLDLKENKTIKNTDGIPDGWIKGRNKWNKNSTCEYCKNKFIASAPSNRFCSRSCKLSYNNENQKHLAEEYYTLYKNGNYSSLREFHRSGNVMCHQTQIGRLFNKHIKEFQNKNCCDSSNGRAGD